jgi:hypothetical protein
MKPLNYLILCLTAFAFTQTFGQPVAAPLGSPDAIARPAAPAEAQKLTRFDLDFQGGTPAQLIAAIKKAMGKPVNAIIPEEHAEFKLPPLKMNNVDVWELFQALELTSQKTEAYVTSTMYYGGPQQNYQQMRTSYGFRTQGSHSDDSIWYFYVEKPPMPPLVSAGVLRVCRFYALTSYLERGLSVDDITTAIQTGWKMLGETETPTINYHKDTKLLIAVGEPKKLETIDAVLKALDPAPESFSAKIKAIMQEASPTNLPAAAPAPMAKPIEPPKSK